MKDYVSIPEAARLLKVTRQRVHAIIADGRLKPERLSERLFLLRRHDVLSLKRNPTGVHLAKAN
jgi:excisionase family DNA binding protein